MSGLRIYVSCLASYNAGILHGAWIDASEDVEEMQEEVNAMLRGSPCPNVMVPCPVCEGDAGKPGKGRCVACRNAGEVQSAEEWAIHDFDGIPSSLGEYCGLQAVADFVGLAEAAEDHVRDEDEALELATAAFENWHSVEDAKEALANDFAGIFDAFRDYADERADEDMDAHSIPENSPLRSYFDYAAYARDLAYSHTVLDVPSGVAVFYT